VSSFQAKQDIWELIVGEQLSPGEDKVWWCLLQFLVVQLHGQLNFLIGQIEKEHKLVEG
jgi:hypothetical protein